MRFGPFGPFVGEIGLAYRSGITPTDRCPCDNVLSTLLYTQDVVTKKTTKSQKPYYLISKQTVKERCVKRLIVIRFESEARTIPVC